MRVRILVISLLCILLGASQVAAQTSLIGTWKAGDKFSYVLEDKYSVSSDSQDSASLKQSLKLDTSWHVMTLALDGIAVVAVEIERVRFRADQTGIPAGWDELSFDSQNPMEPRNKQEMSTFAALTAFVGSQMAITINEKREVLKFELSKPLATHLEKDQTTLELAGFFGHMFTANGMQRRMTNWLIASPPKPVSRGETWRREQVSRYEDFFNCVDSYTLEGTVLWDGQTLMKIDVKTELKLPENEEGKQQAKIADQSGEGVVYFDERTGWVVDAALRQQVVQQGAFIKTSVDTTITSKLLASPKK